MTVEQDSSTSASHLHKYVVAEVDTSNRRVTITLPTDMVDKINSSASASRLSRSAYIVHLLQNQQNNIEKIESLEHDLNWLRNEYSRLSTMLLLAPKQSFWSRFKFSRKKQSVAPDVNEP